MAAITLAISPNFVFAQGGGGAPAAAAPGQGGVPTLTPAQTTAITAMDQALMTRTTAATAARTAFIAAAYAVPRNDADLKEKLALLNSAELALANARANQFLKLQSGANKLGAEQVAMLMARVERADRAGGPGGGNQERPIVAQFDADKNGRLNAAERARAVEFLSSNAGAQGGRGGPGGRGGNRPPASPGVKLTPADVKNFPDAPLYDAAVLRTFFIELENPNWEAELVAFNNTDVEVPAKITVDGKVYPDVGIHFRGNSSFGVGNGYKRSLNLTFDFVHENQAILGYRALNFLNANDDPTFLRTVLSLHIARQYIPAPKANLVRVVINGENWGIYANAQQFNKEFVSENFKTTQGTRWKVPQGGGGGIGGFRYVDQDANSYRTVFQIKSKDQPAAWTALIELTRALQQTPTEQLQVALAPMLDIDGYLRFLALDNAMANGDGFYTRGADYSLYLDPNGRFHLIFYDANEMFSSGGGGRGGGPAGGTALNPLAAQNDTSKPIISRILEVPSLRAKYIGFVREIAEKSFDWKTLGPVVKQYRDLISEDVARDTRKLFTTEQFLAGTADEPGPGNLRSFFDQRRAFLLNWSEPGARGTAP
jgi:hypothetical protein